MAESGKEGFEAWVKDTLGSAKPEIVQKILAVLEEGCFESAAHLAEFSEGSAELAKRGIPQRLASILLQNAKVKAAVDAAEVLTAETHSSTGDSAPAPRTEVLSAENSTSDLANVEPPEVLEEAEQVDVQPSEILGAMKSSADIVGACEVACLNQAIPESAEVLRAGATEVDDAFKGNPSTSVRPEERSLETPEAVVSSSQIHLRARSLSRTNSEVTQDDWCVVEGETLDFTKLGDYVERSNNVLKQHNQQKVSLFLGSTGAGKTTLLYHIAGKRLVVKPGERVFQPAPDQDLTDLKDIQIGHGDKSRTMWLSPWTNSDTDAVYMDCAGYLDTRGAEIDIATSLSIRKLAETCKSLRFIVVVGCDLLVSSDRGGSFRQLCTVICQCVKDFKRYSGAFSFVFSHVDMLRCWEQCRSDPDVENNIKRCTAEILERLKAILTGTLKIRAMLEVRNLLSLLIAEMKCPEKARKGSFMIFHPTWCTAEECRDCLENFDKRDRCLTMPKEAVQCVLTPEQDSKLRRQLQQGKLRLESFINEGDWKSVEEYWNALHSMTNLIELPELQSSLEESRVQLGKHDRDLSLQASELVDLGAGETHGTFTAKDAQAALKCFETLGFLARLLHSDRNVQEQWKKTVIDKLRVLKEQVLIQCTGNILTKPALPVADMQLRLLRLKAWSDADKVTFSSEFDGARTAVNELFQQMVALSSKQSPFGLQDLPTKCKTALHLKHIAFEVNPSLWDGEVIDMKGAAEEAARQAHQLLDKSKAESIELVTSFLTGKDPTNAALLESIRVAFESFMFAQAELQDWLHLTPELSKCVSMAISELIQVSRPVQLQDEVEKLVREKQFDRLEAPLKSDAFCRVLPVDAAEKSGAAHASGESMRRVCVTAEHLGNDLEEFFKDLLASKEVYLEKSLALLAAFKAASWLDQLRQDSCFIRESLLKWQSRLREA